MKRKKYWIVVTQRGVPITINGQLPIYWYRKSALEIAKMYNAGVISCQVKYEVPMFNPSSINQ